MRALLFVAAMTAAACGAAYGMVDPPPDEPGPPETGADDDAMSAAPDAAIDGGSGGCADDKAACRNTTFCDAGTCLTPDHAPPGFGTFVRAADLTNITISDDDVAFDTNTGAIAPVRPANADPTIFEVKAGIGFVRLPGAPIDVVDGGAADGGTAPPLALWTVASLDITGGQLTVRGAAAAWIASRTTLNLGVGARIDVSAVGRNPGPGGFTGGAVMVNGGGCGGGHGTSGGGGGAAFGSRGGNGGDGDGGVVASCDALDLRSALFGGSGGGGGNDSAPSGLYGGGGGGALQLTAMDTITLGGLIVASGGGGRTSSGNFRNGSGGGSGGIVYLEAPVISIVGTAALFANGGGGGSASPNGDPCTATPEEAEDGRLSLVVASGSHCSPGFGGNGAIAGSNATSGVLGDIPQANGGGGGGFGHFVLHTVAGGLSVAPAGISASPTLTSTATKIYADWK